MTDETPKRPQRHGGNPFAHGVPAPVTPPKPVRPSSGSPRASAGDVYNAALGLGATPHEAAELSKPEPVGQRIPPRKMTDEEVQAMVAAEDRRWFWEKWKAREMGRFRTMDGRRAAVALLEESISGMETAVPDGLEDALAFLAESKEPGLPRRNAMLGDGVTLSLYGDLKNEYLRAKRRRR